MLFFLPISVFRRKGISNGIQMERYLREDLFWNECDPEDLECKSRSSRGGHEGGGRTHPMGHPPISWAPRAATDLLLPPIYTHVPREHQNKSRRTISTTVTFCIHEIPYGSLRRRSAGRGPSSRRASISS